MWCVVDWALSTEVEGGIFHGEYFTCGDVELVELQNGMAGWGVDMVVENRVTYAAGSTCKIEVGMNLWVTDIWMWLSRLRLA